MKLPILPITLLSLFSLLQSAGCQAQRPEAASQSTYLNPVLSADFPDPTVIRAADGLFYAYATQARRNGKMTNIQVAQSANLRDWTVLPDALPQRPVWADSTQDFWAPHVQYLAATKQYVMYFSGESDAATSGKCLGVATAGTPEGPFTPLAEPLLCGEGFVNIDPMSFLDPKSGRLYLYWGSGFQAIKVRELTADGLAFAPGSVARSVVFPGKDATYNILIEGAWLTYKNNQYYLYYSGDNCCGDKANYAVMVARAPSPTGPFVRLGEANGTGRSTILEKSSTWNAPGHNSIVADNSGQEWIIYHAIRRDAASNGRVMLIDRIRYSADQWPQIDSGQPSSTPQPLPVFK